MTTAEITTVVGVVFTICVQVFALIWGAAKMSGEVAKVNASLNELKTDFRQFLVDHKQLERLVGTHSTAIALISQATNIKIRHTDINEGFGHDPTT